MPQGGGSQPSFKKSTPQNSVLSSGEWYKIGVTGTGVYRIDYQFLKNLGASPDNVTKKYIHIYGRNKIVFGLLLFGMVFPRFSPDPT